MLLLRTLLSLFFYKIKSELLLFFGRQNCCRCICNCSQFIVGEDGTCGLVYEHAPAEGPPIVFLIDYVVKYM